MISEVKAGKQECDTCGPWKKFLEFPGMMNFWAGVCPQCYLLHSKQNHIITTFVKDWVTEGDHMATVPCIKKPGNLSDVKEERR